MKHHKHEESSLGDLLLILRRDIHESIKKEGFKHELTFSQMEALRFIGPSGKATMKGIADYLKITPPSATGIVDELQKKGLVKREDDKKDRRVVFIVSTLQAQKLFNSMHKWKDAIFHKMLSKLSDKDKKNLERIIKILIIK